MTWALKYINSPYKPFGCGAFVAHVLKKEFNAKFVFPESTGSLKKDPELITNFLNGNLKKTENPIDGDIVLMSGDRRFCHVGIFVKINEKKFVLHTDRKMRYANLCDVRMINQTGYILEGFYSWR